MSWVKRMRDEMELEVQQEDYDCDFLYECWKDDQMMGLLNEQPDEDGYTYSDAMEWLRTKLEVIQ